MERATMPSLSNRATIAKPAPGNSTLQAPEGQIFQQVANLDAVLNDTQNLVNALYMKLKPVLHASGDEGSTGLDDGDKDQVPLARQLENIFNVAVSQRDQLQFLLKRIDI